MPDKSLIKKEILSTLDQYVESLLSICESEIEKQLFALFLQYIFEDMYGLNKSPYPKTTTPIETFENRRLTSINKKYIAIELMGLQEFEIQEYLDKGYTYYNNELIKTVGVSFEDEDIMFLNEKTVYELIPQYEVKLDKTFRLDFALIGFNHSENKSITKTKIAIECDGFEFHSTKEHLTKDNIKNRMLQLDGWKIYRMSGSEIYSIKAFKQIENIFKELRTLSK